MLFELNVVKSFLKLCYLLKQGVQVLCNMHKNIVSISFNVRDILCFYYEKITELNIMASAHHLLHAVHGMKNGQHGHRNLWFHGRVTC